MTTYDLHAITENGPATVWRIADDVCAADAPATTGGPLSSRLARRLVTIYSEPADTVADLDDDTALRQATVATGRTYRATPPRDASTDGQPRQAALVVARWPRPDAQTDGILTTCRRHLADDGCVVLVVTTTTGPARSDHARAVLAAAATAGLRHLHDIAVLAADDGHDTFTYDSDRDPTAASRDTTTRTRDRARAGGDSVATTLVVLGLDRRRP